MDNPETARLKLVVEKAASDLAEHFDSVRIFVTMPGEPAETNSYETGRGNYYAQLGQVAEWLTIQEQFARNWAIKKDESDT